MRETSKVFKNGNLNSLEKTKEIRWFSIRWSKQICSNRFQFAKKDRKLCDEVPSQDINGKTNNEISTRITRDTKFYLCIGSVQLD